MSSRVEGRYRYRRNGRVRDVFGRDIDGLSAKEQRSAFALCEALMPDGSWVQYPEGGRFPEGSLVLEDHDD